MKLFMRSFGWDPNEHMPPYDPGSLKEDLAELLIAWDQGPDNTPGAEWIIPPARGEDRKVVGDDYPYKEGFNIPDNESNRKQFALFDQRKGDALAERLKSLGKEGKLDEKQADIYRAGAEENKELQRQRQVRNRQV